MTSLTLDDMLYKCFIILDQERGEIVYDICLSCATAF